MPFSPLRIAVMLLIFWPWLAPAATRAAAKDDFYQAYYLEREKRDPQAALALYEKAAADRGLPAELRVLAEDAAARCREDLKSADLAQLFPPETIVYVEVNHPGGHLERLIEQLGLIGTPQDLAGGEKGEHVSTVRISPTLLSAFSKFRGLAVGITGFNMLKQQPQWVAVLDPGTDELVRGAVETAVATLGKPGQLVAGVPTFRLDLEDVQVHVGLGKRLVVVSQQQMMVSQTLKRLSDEALDNLSKTDVLGPVLANRQHAMIFAAADFHKIQALVKNVMMAGAHASPGLAIGLAVIDFESFRTAHFQAGVAPDGLAVEAGLQLEEGHHCLAINLLRTPSLSRESLQYVPRGAAVVLMGALGESDGQAGAVSKGETLRQFTGLDIGREFFANIREVSVFLLPPDGQSGEGTEEARSSGRNRILIPDIGLAMTVRDPSKSEAIWSQLLGLPTLALGPPKTPQQTLDIAGTAVHAYAWPGNVTIYFAATDDAIVVAPSEALMRAALHARETPSESLPQDEGFAPILASLSADTSKTCMVHVGRTLRFARQFMPADEREKVARFEESLGRTAVCVQTRETPNSLHFSARVSGLPDLGGLIAGMGGLEALIGCPAKTEQGLTTARKGRPKRTDVAGEIHVGPAAAREHEESGRTADKIGTPAAGGREPKPTALTPQPVPTEGQK